jgi:hypothetical protein
VLGIRSIMIVRHLLRYTFAALSGLVHSQETPQDGVRKQVSGACLRQLLTGSLPNQG